MMVESWSITTGASGVTPPPSPCAFVEGSVSPCALTAVTMATELSIRIATVNR